MFITSLMTLLTLELQNKIQRKDGGVMGMGIKNKLTSIQKSKNMDGITSRIIY